jgi:hypothetical protein
MAHAQDNATISKEELPYAVIPAPSAQYTAGTVAARVVDGLGFRYYWVTDSLRSEDLSFKPNEAARTTEETIDHIFELTSILKNACLGKANEGSSGLDKMSFEEKRTETLRNIKAASDILLTSSGEDIASYKIIFTRKDGSTTEYPFWNMLNGPLADAIWHVGQVVSFRRSSGNPLNPNVSMLNGKLRN